MKTGKEISDIKFKEIIEDQKKYIGTQLYKERKRKGYSIDRVSKLSKVKWETIYNIENGITSYTIDTILKICIRIGVNFILITR